MNFLEGQLKCPTRRARLQRWGVGGLIVVAAAEVVLPLSYGSDAHFWFERIPAWGSLYGLMSCVAIIVLSKLVGKMWLMRREDYYDA